MALPKILRLCRRDFISVKKHGFTLSSKYLSATCYQRPPAVFTSNRFSLVISAKFHKQAVIRNRYKRLITKHLLVTPSLGYDFIIYLKKGVLNLTRAEINTELDSFLSKIHSEKS